MPIQAQNPNVILIVSAIFTGLTIKTDKHIDQSATELSQLPQHMHGTGCRDRPSAAVVNRLIS